MHHFYLGEFKTVSEWQLLVVYPTFLTKGLIQPTCEIQYLLMN